MAILSILDRGMPWLCPWQSSQMTRLFPTACLPGHFPDPAGAQGDAGQNAESDEVTDVAALVVTVGGGGDAAVVNV